MGKTFSTGLLTNGIWQDASNNIGIGGSPSGSYKFEVNGNSKVLNNFTISSTTNAGLIAATNSTTGYTYIDIINNGASGRNYQIGLGGNAAAAGYANNLYFDLVGVGNIMTLTSGRNVGIGTSSPGSALHVLGSTNHPAIISTTNPTTLYTSYRYNSTTDVGYIGNGTGIVSGGSASDFGFLAISNMVFGTGGSSTERMRITSGGDLLIAKSSADWSATGIQTENNGKNLGITHNGAENNLFLRKNNATGVVARFWYNSTDCGNISISTTNTSFNTSASDLRLKKNIEIWDENVLDLFKDINPKLYHFNSQEDNEGKIKGFIAQEMVNKFPEAYPLIQQSEKEERYMYNPSGMMVYVMKALQEAYLKIKELSAKVSALENKS